MSVKICFMVLFVSAVTAPAQQDQAASIAARHDGEDQRWAIRNGLSKSDIRAIRTAAGISDKTENTRITELDARSLKQRNHILLVETGNGSCLRLHIVEKTATGFKEIWSLSGLKDRGWSIEEIAGHGGTGICSQAPRSPSAHATPDGRIVVEIPTLSDPFQRSMPVTTYSFKWDGAGYAVSEDERY